MKTNIYQKKFRCLIMRFLLIIFFVDIWFYDLSFATSNQTGSQNLNQSSNQNPNQALKNKSNGFAATVKTDGAGLYSQPDFDSNLLVMLNVGDQIKVSKGLVGQGVKFRRARAGAVIGYISNDDISIVKADSTLKGASGGSSQTRTAARAGSGRTVGAKTKAGKAKASGDHLPMIFAKFIGGSIGQTGYKGAGGKSPLTVYGLKVTGPDLLISGPIQDLSIVIHNGAPSYLNSASDSKSTGFVIFADLSLLLPLFQRQDAMIYAGIGPLLVLSSLKTATDAGIASRSSLNPGLSLNFGGGVRYPQWSNLALRMEAKYLVEKQSYQSLQAVVLTSF
jgi:hypothetical protein